MQPLTLVTGASSGIGAALAETFAKEGHQLALVARRTDQLDAVADRITRTGAPRPLVIPADLTAPDCAQHIDDELTRHGYEVQYLVNNAGVGAFGDLIQLPQTTCETIIALNIRAPTALSLHWIESMKRHRGGILNVASIAAFVPRPGMAMYHASKAYLLSLSEALHEELKEHGVNVCALCPGPVHTEFFERAGVTPDVFPNFFYRSAERVAREGYQGLMAGQTVVIPGFANKVFCQLPRLFPRAMWQSMLALRRSSANNDQRLGAKS